MITLKDAKKVISAAEKKAIEIGQPMNIAVVDSGGNLIAHERMDGAWIGSIDISTKDLAIQSQLGGQFYGIHVSNNGKMIIFAGDIPLKRERQVIGAIWVSGGSGEQDHLVA